MLQTACTSLVPKAHTPVSAERVATLYRKFGGIIYARCRRRLSDDASAEIATVEIFTRIVKELEDAPDDRAALACVYRAIADS